MHRRNASATFNMIQVLKDIVSVAAAYALAAAVYRIIQGAWLFLPHLWLFVAICFVMVLVMFLLRMYNYTTFYYVDRIFLRSFAAVAVAAVFTSTLVFLFHLTTTSRLLFVLFCAFSFAFVSLQRVFFRHLSLLEGYKSAPYAVFVGRNECYERYKHYIEQTDMRVRFIKTLEAGDPLFSQLPQFEAFLVEHHIGEVVISYEDVCEMNYKAYCVMCEEMGITLRLVLNMLDLPVSKRYLSSIGTYPVITYHSVSHNKAQMFIKSAVDYAVAFLMLVLTLPITLATAIAVKLESPGPVFFRQQRAGINGKTFTIYKFRSMYLDAEERKKELLAKNEIDGGLMFKIQNDPRITKVGAFIRKTSIDELPQLLNVLKGDMSLVGTRPPTLDEVQRYERHHRRRISIKPGITGMWQTHGRSQVLNFEQVVQMDLDYIDQWSLGLDIRLMFKTLAVVFRRRGAY